MEAAVVVVVVDAAVVVVVVVVASVVVVVLADEATWMARAIRATTKRYFILLCWKYWELIMDSKPYRGGARKCSGLLN